MNFIFGCAGSVAVSRLPLVVRRRLLDGGCGLLPAVASLVEAHGLAAATGLVGTRPGTELMSPAVTGRLTTGPPQKS